MKSHTDADGNVFTFQYTQIATEWHLTQELDTNGRAISYSSTLVAGKNVLSPR